MSSPIIYSSPGCERIVTHQSGGSQSVPPGHPICTTWKLVEMQIPSPPQRRSQMSQGWCPAVCVLAAFAKVWEPLHKRKFSKEGWVPKGNKFYQLKRKREFLWFRYVTMSDGDSKLLTLVYKSIHNRPPITFPQFRSTTPETCSIIKTSHEASFSPSSPHSSRRCLFFREPPSFFRPSSVLSVTLLTPAPCHLLKLSVKIPPNTNPS